MKYKGHRKTDGKKRALDRNLNRKSIGAHGEVFWVNGQEFVHYHRKIAYRIGQPLY